MTSPIGCSAADATISMMVVNRLLEAIEQKGVSRVEVLRAVERDDLMREAPDARVPHREVDRICEVAIKLTRDPALGLHWAEALNQRTFVPVSYLLAHANSLRHAFELLTRCQRLFCDRAVYTLVEADQTAFLRLARWDDCPDVVQRFAAEMVLAGFYTMMCAFHPGMRPARICFTYLAPRYSSEYERVFGMRVQFNQPQTELVFERRLLDMPSPDSDADMQAALDAVVEKRLIRTTHRTPYAVRVRSFLEKHMPARINMPDVARALGMSERSLRRQLAEEGTTFREIEHLQLGANAERLLRDEQLTVQQTAHKLGFSDTTTFHRAFKRWKGVTPRVFRNR